MKKYEPTKVEDILKAPLLKGNNFKKLLDEFNLFVRNDIINKDNHKINNIFLENNNNYLDNGNIINFGKNGIIENELLSPIQIPSSDSQKNKFSINSDKIQENSLSPIPLNAQKFPIIRDINNNESDENYKNNVLPIFKKSNFDEFNEQIPFKEIKFNIENKNIIEENKWKKLGKALILNEIIKNNFNNIKKVPKIIIPRLLIFQKKNGIINNNNINNSFDMKNSIEQSTKIVTSAHIKPILNNSLDDIGADNSNFYYIEKDNNEEKEYNYEPTNVQNILNINHETIVDINKFNSLIKELNKLTEIYKNVNANNNENESSPEQNINLFSNNNNNIYTIKEEDEDIYDPDSRNLSMKNSYLKNTLGLSKNKENKDSLNRLNNIDNKEIKEINPPGINKFNDKNDLEVPDFSDYFRSEPKNLKPMELKINNISDKNDLLFEKINPKENFNINNSNIKSSFPKQVTEPNYNFSFGKMNLNNNNNDDKNIFSPDNKEINNNEFLTFDKNKNKSYSEIEDLEEEEEKNGIKKDKKMNNNLEKVELINTSENSNKNIENPFTFSKLNNVKEDQVKNYDKINVFTHINQSENKNFQDINSKNKNTEIINDIPSFQEEKQIKTNEITNNDIIEKNKNDNINLNEKIIYKNVDLNNNLNSDGNNLDINKNSKTTDSKNIKLEDKESNQVENIFNKEESLKLNNKDEKEINDLNNDEQIIVNFSDSIEGNKLNKIEFNRHINSPEVYSSFSSKKQGLDSNINIKSNLFNFSPKIITMSQIQKLDELYPDFNLEISDKSINKDFLKYFLNDYNCIIFKNNMKDYNNIFKISLRSYFNILNRIRKISKIEINISDSFVNKLINFTSQQIEQIKREENINYNELISREKNRGEFPKINNKTMNFLFSKLKSKIKEIKNYYIDFAKKKKKTDNIVKLRDDLNIIFEDIIECSKIIYKNSIIEKINCYQKIVDELKISPNISNKNISNKNIIQNKDIKENKFKNNSFINSPLFIGGLLLPLVIIIIFFLINFSN